MMESQTVCIQWPKGLCRRHETCKFYHAPLDLPALRPGQCSWLKNGAKRCENNAAFVETDRALCFDHTEAGRNEALNISGEARTFVPERATKRVSGKGRMVDPFQVRHRVDVAREESGGCSISGTFADPKLPLIVDIGCAQGRFLLQLAKMVEADHTGCRYNYVGFELRGTLVDAANDVVKSSELNGKAAFVQGEAKSIMHEVLSPLLNVGATPGKFITSFSRIMCACIGVIVPLFACS
jgi:hypothetical protein